MPVQRWHIPLQLYCTHRDEARPAAWTLAGLGILKSRGWAMGNSALRADHCA
jgi:hypothetical protein